MSAQRLRLGRRALFALPLTLALPAEASVEFPREVLRPYLSGTVVNVPPLLVDPALLIYAINEGPIEAVTAVRDGGHELLSAGDFSTEEFAEALIFPGFFGTCLARGEVRLGCTPAFMVTVDASADGPVGRGFYACSHDPRGNDA